jgi:hypothetical protein
MTWAQQRQLVKSLSDRAQDKRREARHVRDNLTVWMTSSLGSLETLAWVFAMGSFWAAGRSTAAANGGERRSLIAAVNTSLLAWQLVNRQVVLAHPAADRPSKAQR